MATTINFRCGVLHGDRVVVRVEPHQGLRISRCGDDALCLEGLLRQWEEGGLVFQEQLPLRSRLPTSALCQVGQAVLAQLRVERLQGIDLRHGDQGATPCEAQQPFAHMSLLVGAAD